MPLVMVVAVVARLDVLRVSRYHARVGGTAQLILHRDRTGTMTIRLQDLVDISRTDVDAALSRNDSAELRLVSITLALSFPDRGLIEDVCIRLFAHPDIPVRCNAVASLGYIARRFRSLDRERVLPVIESALLDPDNMVRDTAKSAADEIHQFLHWTIAGHVYG